jgi:hypothetical protein
MENKKGILIVGGAGVVLVAAALLIFAVPTLAGDPTGVQGASGCLVTDAQGQVSCPMANSAAQDATGDANISGGTCH